MLNKSIYSQTGDFDNLIIKFVKLLILIIMLPIVLSGCINLREDYPKIEYYELNPITDIPVRIKADGILQVRPFDASTILSEKRFIVEKSSGGYDKFYYHRWTDEFQDLFTWLTITRLSNQKCFTGGVVSQGTAMLPNFILEGNILQLQIYNDVDNKKDSSYILLTVKISLMGNNRDSSSTGSSTGVMYNNVYAKKIIRESNKAATIAPAVNNAANEIITMFSEDIIKEINK